MIKKKIKKNWKLSVVPLVGPCHLEHNFDALGLMTACSARTYNFVCSLFLQARTVSAIARRVRFLSRKTQIVHY